MLANTRFYFLLSLLLVFPLASWVPVAAQVNGVPPSVTSLGFGGSNNPTPGIRASVTSLGPDGYGDAQAFLGNCCANYFLWSSSWPSRPNPRLAQGRHRRHHDDQTFVPVAVPAYIPYAVPYAADPEDDSADDDDASDPGSGGSGPANREIAAKRPVRHDSGHGSAQKPEPKEAAPERPEEPVAVQPTTVLVFKDGHRSDVVNYAIVGGTLFDFAEGRARKILLADLDLAATQKVNDDRGVDFKVPPAGK